ncbi:hypothetical protein T484DRAFT_1751490 [Baffinella frigidus]|nr:hypothetical protein T484DRAFT_1751490 [Cryptophyta sp. CCMP2293]
MSGSGRGVLLLSILALTLPSECIYWDQHVTGPQGRGRQQAPGVRSTSPFDSRTHVDTRPATSLRGSHRDEEKGGGERARSPVRSPTGCGPARPSVRGWGPRPTEEDVGVYEDYAEAGGWVDGDGGEGGEGGAEQYVQYSRNSGWVDGEGGEEGAQPYGQYGEYDEDYGEYDNAGEWG